MKFSPLMLTATILEPLRYFFANYTSAAGIVWSPDDSVSNIDVNSINNFNTIETQQKPRVLVGRGTYQIGKSGLTNNMASSPGVKASFGAEEMRNLVFIEGSATITIEANNEGTCELLTDMVSHFLVWTRQYICSSQGFSEFALPLGVSDCHPADEDTTKFQVTINVPWRMEEDWRTKRDAITLKGFFTNFNPVPANVT